MKLPTKSMLVGIGLAALLREKTYEVVAQILEQTKWLGTKPEKIQQTLLSRGEREYSRLVREVERNLDKMMKSVQKTGQKKK